MSRQGRQIERRLMRSSQCPTSDIDPESPSAVLKCCFSKIWPACWNRTFFFFFWVQSEPQVAPQACICDAECINGPHGHPPCYAVVNTRPRWKPSITSMRTNYIFRRCLHGRTLILIAGEESRWEIKKKLQNKKDTSGAAFCSHRWSGKLKCILRSTESGNVRRFRVGK